MEVKEMTRIRTKCRLFLKNIRRSHGRAMHRSRVQDCCGQILFSIRWQRCRDIMDAGVATAD